jgi:hypothetical protein
VAPRQRSDDGGALGGANSGVAERCARDEAAAAAAAVPPEAVAAYALRKRALTLPLIPNLTRVWPAFGRALQRKAALYKRLQRDGGGDDARRSDMDARYNVDFAMKARRSA